MHGSYRTTECRGRCTLQAGNKTHQPANDLRHIDIRMISFTIDGQPAGIDGDAENLAAGGRFRAGKFRPKLELAFAQAVVDEGSKGLCRRLIRERIREEVRQTSRISW